MVYIMSLQVIFDCFYDPNSCRDPCSLAASKVVLNSKQVTPDVRRNYYACSLFLEKIADAHLCDAAFRHLNISMESQTDHLPDYSTGT